MSQNQIDGGQSRSSGPQQSDVDYWLHCVRQWYPDLHGRTYFLPPLHFNRVAYDLTTLANQEVHIPREVQESHARDDHAQRRVLTCLRELVKSREEAMMVISQLKFGQYLNKPCYEATTSMFRRLVKSESKDHQRDFDILIIHSKYGLITGEIKSVGANFDQLGLSREDLDAIVTKTVKKALQQLNISGTSLQHITSDLKSIKITKTLLLPNVSELQLTRVLEKDQPLLQDLRQCLGTQETTIADTVKLCLTSEQTLDEDTEWNFKPDVFKNLTRWWKELLGLHKPHLEMTSSEYENLVARFCGPATTVQIYCVTPPRTELRTEGEGVYEVGQRMARLVLYPEQVHLLHTSPPLVFLTGPPGTGKSVVLLLQGLTWLQRGHDVNVVSTSSTSRAAAYLIEHQLSQTMGTAFTGAQRVHRLQYDLDKEQEITQMVRHLVETANGRQLCILVDEAKQSSSNSFTTFCDEVTRLQPGVYLWAAAMLHDVRPSCLVEYKLTTPLRSPPMIVREVKMAWEIRKRRVHDYTDYKDMVPVDGPPMRRIVHRDGRSGHTVDRPMDCVECGRQISHILTDLQVGVTSTCRPDVSTGSSRLQYRDVLVLVDVHPRDDRVDNSGKVRSIALGLVRGLRECHVPVRVVDSSDDAAIRDTALAVSDMVTIVRRTDVHGLERKIVVIVKGYGALTKDYVYYRLHGASRCTSQLVWIDVELSESDTESSDEHAAGSSIENCP